MRKRILFICLLIVCMLLSACSSNTPKSESTDVSDSKSELASSESFSENAEDFESSSNNDSFAVECPYIEIEGIDCEKINRVINEKTNEYFDRWESISDFSMRYEITNTSDFVSVVYYGSVNPAEAVYPTDFVFSVNVSYNGELMKLSDFTTINLDLVTRFRDACKDSQSDETFQYISEYTDDELLSMLTEADMKDSTIYSFVKSGQISLSVAVPNAIGDYFVVSLEQ